MTQTYRVGIIGRTGRGDYGHAVDMGFVGLGGVELVAVADDNPAGLAVAAKRLKLDRAYADYRAMLDEAKPHIVAICSRWVEAHYEMATAAIERGIHVYIEKPFVASLEQADRLADACARGHVKLAVAHPTRYSPLIGTIARLMTDGTLGQVLEFRARGKEDHRGGGEDLWVLGSHVLDMMHALAGGSPQWCFANVTTGGRAITAADVAPGNEGLGPLAGDAVHAQYAWPNGVRGYFASVRKAGGPDRVSRYALQIFGSAGVLELVEGTLPQVWFVADPAWSPGRSRAVWQPVSSAGVGVSEPLSDPIYKTRHGLAIRDLISAIEGQREPLCGVLAARAVVEMIAAVFESQRLGRPVSLPLPTRVNPLTLLGAASQ